MEMNENDLIVNVLRIWGLFLSKFKKKETKILLTKKFKGPSL